MRPVLIGLLLFIFCLPAPRAEQTSVTLTGDLKTTGAITLAQLEKLEPEAITWNHKGTRTFRGVPLERVIAAYGFEPGAMSADVPKREKRAGWKFIVLATAHDGFQAVYSCAEISTLIGNTQVYLVWEQDGKPLSAEEGPLRLVCTTDKEGARSVYNLHELRVIDIRKLAARPAGD